MLEIAVFSTKNLIINDLVNFLNFYRRCKII